MKEFERPELEVIKFDSNDVITTSGSTCVGKCNDCLIECDVCQCVSVGV